MVKNKSKQNWELGNWILSIVIKPHGEIVFSMRDKNYDRKLSITNKNNRLKLQSGINILYLTLSDIDRIIHEEPILLDSEYIQGDIV